MENIYRLTLDTPFGTRQWVFTEEQIKGMSPTWRESTTEELTAAVVNEFERMA